LRSNPAHPNSPGGDLPALYVSRLERLIRLRRDYEGHLNDLGVQLLDRSIVATVRDCDDSGVGAQARALLGQLPDGAGFDV
jgi:hypothetical protein